MKSPDEIKAGLLQCDGDDESISCDNCPYDGEINCIIRMTGDALALIRRLQAENAEQAERIQQLEDQVPSWISVEERLPERGAIVLCYTKYFYEVLQWDDDAEQWVGQYSVNAKHYVSHWMLLPEPPKESES